LLNNEKVKAESSIGLIFFKLKKVRVKINITERGYMISPKLD